MSANNRFPVGFPFGSLAGKDFSGPLLLPSEGGGALIKYSGDQEDTVNLLVENSVLYLLNALPEKLLEVHVFDFGFKKRFPYLADLQALGAYKIYLNSREADIGLQNLEDTSRERHHGLLSVENPTLDAFNSTVDHPYPYQLMVLNLAYFPENYINQKRFEDFVESAKDAGIYLLAFADVSQVDVSEKLLKKIISYLPPITINDEELNFGLHPSFAKIQQFADRFGFKAVIHADRREELVKAFQERSQQAKEDEPLDFLMLPIGKSPDGRSTIHFSLGDKSKNYHAIITGTTGTGKSTLLNNLIVSVAENYSANELRLYLMDFKQGVEFKAFREHPNCEKIFLGSGNLDAATDLLESFVKLMEDRNDLFNQYSHVKDISQYNSVAKEPIPRVVLIIDEVQDLFSGSYKRQDLFKTLLTKVAKQGRSFGIHLVLSTQTIAGSIKQSLGELMKQFSLRVTYLVTEAADAEAVFTLGNLAPLHLNNFELIYNDRSGLKTANQLCRADRPKDILGTLAKIRNERSENDMISPMLFEKSTKEVDSKSSDESGLSSDLSSHQWVKPFKDETLDRKNKKDQDTLSAFVQKHNLDKDKIQGMGADINE